MIRQAEGEQTEQMMECPAARRAHLQDVLRGRSNGDPQTRSSSNMVRVFVSSAFTDMSAERRALLDKAYPEVHAFCCGLGLAFEVVDLRWGLRGVSSGDHEVAEVCLQEIRDCQRVSAGPAFVALLGNRYGHRALPRLIPEKQFDTLLSKLSKKPDGIKQLKQWFVRDDNAVPPTYILQPITAHFPCYNDPQHESEREKDVLSWRFTESQLLQLLWSAATAAEIASDITAEQKRHFYTSVTEKEFDQGLWDDDAKPSALLFVREIPRQRARDGPKRLAKFMDVTAEGLLDAEAQQLLTGLKSRLYASFRNNLSLHCVELSKGSIDPKRREHAQYLDGVCQQFVSQMKAEITTALGSPEDGRPRRIRGSVEDGNLDVSEVLVEEIEWHAALSSKLCRDLYGREGLLGKLCFAMWESTNICHSPLVVHGAAGMGKTALLCRLVQEMRSVLDAGAVVVVRLLSARHPQRPDIDHVLRSVCQQICLACGLCPPTPLTANSHLELIMFFHKLLTQVSQQSFTLLVVLDALDQLAHQHSAHKLHWLPATIPPNVHLVVSMDTNSQVFVNMRLRSETYKGFFEVESLSHEEGRQIMESQLGASRRTLTAEQSDAVLRSFELTGCPLHLQLALCAARRWTSFTPLAALHLGPTTQAMMSKLLVMLEEKHGKALVGGALGYISLAREGLLEAELCDIMSLDDDVINEVYRYSLPPTPSLIRLPPLLWAHLKRDLQDLLEERWTAGVTSLSFSNRCLWEVVSAQYLKSDQMERSLRNLAEYFLGRWSGKLKPLTLPGLSLLLSDRKVPPQPLWFAPGLANVRKLEELPHHLLHAGLWEELRQEVLGNAEWLYCKSRVCGLSSLIQDLDQCSQYMDCTETRLVRDTLVLMKPTLDFLEGHMDESLFYTELLARIYALAIPFPSVIGRLRSQCEEWFQACAEPILIPKCSFLQQPGGALQYTLTGPHGGVLCVEVSVEEELLVVGSDDGVVSVWSLSDQQLIHLLLGHTGAVMSVKVIDSSTHCLSLAADCSLRMWSLMNGQQLLCIEGAWPVDPASSPAKLHLSEQNRLLFVHSSTQVKVWTLDGTELTSVCGDDGLLVLGVLEESVVSLSGSGLLRMSQPLNQTPTVQTQLGNLGRRLNTVNSVMLPKHRRLLLVSEDGILYQISGTGRGTGRWTTTEFPLRPSLFSVTEDEKILMAGHELTLSLFNILPESVGHFLDLHHHDRVLSACTSSDGRLLASGSADQLIQVWSLTSGALLDTLCGSHAPVTALHFFSGLLLSASSAATSVHMWNLTYDARHKPTAHIPAGSAYVAVTKDGDQVFYVQHQSQTEVVSWDHRTGTVSERLAVSAEVCCLDIAQHKRLLLCGLTSGTVLIYPLALPQETLCIPPPESLSQVLCLAVSPQEKHVGVAYEDAVRLFEITTRDSFPAVEGPLQSFTLSLLHAPLSSMALLSDCRLLYGTSCGEVTLHDLTSGSSSTLEPHRSRVTCVTASNWGGHALVGSEDAVQRLWALNPLVLDHTMEYKGFCFEGVLSAAFSESDQFVFTGSQDRTIKVWDVSSGNLLYVQYVYAPVVTMVTFRNGFVALSQQGFVIREVFRCPDHISPDYNPLKNVKAQYRVVSREKDRYEPPKSQNDLQDFNPAKFNLNLMSMLRAKPSSTCVIL